MCILCIMYMREGYDLGEFTRYAFFEKLRCNYILKHVLKITMKSFNIFRKKLLEAKNQGEKNAQLEKLFSRERANLLKHPEFSLHAVKKQCLIWRAQETGNEWVKPVRSSGDSTWVSLILLGDKVT